MKNIGLKINILFVVLLLTATSYAQNLNSSLEKVYDKIVNAKEIHLEIDLKAYRLDNQKQVIDKGKMIYVKDNAGYYFKTLDYETFIENNTGLKINHDAKQAYLFEIDNTSKEEEMDLGMNSLKDAITKMQDSKFKVEESKNGDKQIFKISKLGIVQMELHIRKDKLLKVIHYPIQKVEYRGQTLQTVLVMDYKYVEKGKSRTKQLDLVNTSTGKFNSEKLKSYRLKDMRTER